MAKQWVPGVDSSFDPLTADEAVALRKAGVRIYTQCLWDSSKQPAPRVISLRNALNAGLIIAGYISVDSSEHSGAWHVDQGRAGIPDDIWAKLAFVAVDVELPGIKLVTIYSALEALRLYGKDPLIYTSYHAWVDYLGNPLTFTFAKLWNAFWDKDSNLAFENSRWRYGGWTLESLIGEQYTGGEYVAGQYADRDVFYFDFEVIPDPAIDAANIALLKLRIAILETSLRLLLDGNIIGLMQFAKWASGG